MVRKIVLVVALVSIVFLSFGCQTVAGVGGDIKWTAEATADMLEGQ